MINKDLKILIIDDKPDTEGSSSEQMLSKLTPKQKELVDLYKDISSLWMLNENQDAIIDSTINYKRYSHIFLHLSFDNPLLKNPSVLINALPRSVKIVLFSGERNENLTFKDEDGQYSIPQCPEFVHYEIRRSVYLNNFSNFLNSYLDDLSKQYRIEALFDRNFNVRKEYTIILFNNIINNLEESNYNAVNTDFFNDFFRLLGYSNDQINKIRSNYLNMDYQDFYDSLEREIQNL